LAFEVVVFRLQRCYLSPFCECKWTMSTQDIKQAISFHPFPSFIIGYTVKPRYNVPPYNVLPRYKVEIIFPLPIGAHVI
jgi:hypothetical protein